MRSIPILILSVFLLLNPLNCQDIFEMVVQNDYRAVKNFKGDVNIRDEGMATPLMWAVYKTDLKMVKLLVSKKAKPGLKGWIFFEDTLSNNTYMYGSCLVIAAGENKGDILKYFIKKMKVPVGDKEINLYENKDNGWDALQWASVKGNNDIIKYLVSAGADINSKAETDLGQTPLMFAITYKNNETMKLLIKLGADFNLRDLFGNTPLMYAFHHNNRDAVKLLITKGANTGIEGVMPEDLLREYYGTVDFNEL